MRLTSRVFRSPGGASQIPGNSAAYTSFQAITSNRSVSTQAGNRMASRICCTSGGSGQSPQSAGRGRAGQVGEAEQVGRARPRRAAACVAMASSTWTLALIGRPCSSQVYQVTPTPASWASSSRRSPAVRRAGTRRQAHVLGADPLPPGAQERGELGPARRRVARGCRGHNASSSRAAAAPARWC